MDKKKVSQHLEATHPPSSDGESTEEFVAVVKRAVGDGLTVLALGLARRLGLLDILAKLDKPATSQEIADLAGYHERYVRELLGNLVVGRILEVDASGSRFYLRPHWRHALSRDGLDVAIFADVFGVFAHALEDVESCFNRDGPQGIESEPYNRFHQIQEVRAHEANPSLLKMLREVPELFTKLEFGGLQCCEIGCSNGHTILHLAETFTKSSFTGLEIANEVVAKGNKVANEKRLQNANFLLQDVSNMPDDWSNKWDLIMAHDVMHDVPGASHAFAEIHRVLKPGGIFWMRELNANSEVSKNVDKPFSQWIYGSSLFHCLPISLNVEGSEGLGGTWGKQFAFQMMENAGLRDIKEVGVIGYKYFCMARKEN